MPRVYIAPSPAEHPLEGGILRVIQAMRKHLPAFGWDIAGRAADADLICTHGVWTVEGYEHLPVVQCNHGLMWSDYFGHRWDDVNAQLVRAIKRADAVVAPSRWVANAIARGIAVDPVVIHHGVDYEEWEALPTKGYVLWNKARGDEVSDYHEVEKLAAMMPDVQFVSTIGTPTANLKICGVQSHAEMKRIVAEAGVMLALPRETFGIGTLEAMAAGVPVAGWDYGGQHDIVIQGETGYLAPYGDYKALADCVRRCLAERATLGENARLDVGARWGWLPRIREYARLFFDVLYDNSYGKRDDVYFVSSKPLVSVIVTAFNLGRFLPDALQSVLEQTMWHWECIIVDDCSIDNTAEVAKKWGDLPRFTYIRPDHNLGLPAARNFGIAHARGKYIIPLDADDMLAPDALEILSTALDKDKSLHIAYGHLELMSEDGTARRPTGWGVHSFDYNGQLNHHNQLHYSAMMRRSVFERTQGYRRRSWQAEDAEFWGYVSSFGFNIQRVTAKPTLIYRLRSGSKSSTNDKMGTEWTDGDWSAWYTWRERPANTPFGAQGKAPAEIGRFWPVPHNAEPEVSIIIPVGPMHRELLQDALDSVLAQTFTKWEVIVVNDSGEPLDLRGYAFVTSVDSGGNFGAGFARNLGVKSARSNLLVFLDADDILQPHFLEATIAAYRAEPTPALIYTDFFIEEGRGDAKDIWHVADWDWKLFANKGGINCVTCIVPKAAHEAVNGFDETMVGYEDLDYFMRLAFFHGLCGKRIPQPLMTYRRQLGRRNTNAVNNHKALQDEIWKRYADYFTGRNPVACSGCGGGRAKALPPMQTYNPSAAPQAMASGVNPPPPAADGMVLLEYRGTSMTTLRYVGKVTQSGYRFSASESHKRKYVYKEDVSDLLTKTEPGRAGVPIFVRADEARPVTSARPLAIRDRVVPTPTPVQPFRETLPTPTPTQGVPVAAYATGPLPQATLPRMRVEPIPPTAWEIEEAKLKGTPLPSFKRESGTPVTDLPIVQPLADDVPLEPSMPEYVAPVLPVADAVRPVEVAAEPPVNPIDALIANIAAANYNTIRLAIFKMTPEQKLAAQSAESAQPKPRKGVLKLLEVAIAADREAVKA